MAVTSHFRIVICIFASVLIVNSFKLPELVKETKSQVPNWVSLCGHQYFFSEDKISWNSARETCHLLGGYLVKIDNRHENNCLLDYAMPQGLFNWWWTSGNDIHTEGVWEFEDSVEMDFIQDWSYPHMNGQDE